MPKYIAKQSVGHFLPGEEIKGLDDERIQALLVSGAIEEYKAPVQTPSDDSTGDFKKLLGEVADLKAINTQLTEEKDKALGEVADLKAINTQLTEEKDKALGEVADLKASNTLLTEEKDKALGEVADLAAKVKKLEADLAAAVAKTPKADKTADKGATDPK